MQSEAVSQSSWEADSPASSINNVNGQDVTGGTWKLHPLTGDATPVFGMLTVTAPPFAGGILHASHNDQGAPPKTDKPRPHVCTTCARSFARLEHLKRHERSHTKEKPFECSECLRCFARRDLLLRHQQKLHSTNAISTRPRNSRRESVSGAPVSMGRVRKAATTTGSLTGGNATPALSRPRANTISHLDMSSLGLGDMDPTANRMYALGLTSASTEPEEMCGSMEYQYRGMSASMGYHGLSSLPPLDMHSANLDVSNPLRTAPAHVGFGGFEDDYLFSPGSTVNPAHLHSGGIRLSTPANGLPTPVHGLPSLEPLGPPVGLDAPVHLDEFAWMRHWHMQWPLESHEDAVDESSPSHLSSGDSPADFADPANSTLGGLAMSDHPSVMSDHHYQWSQNEFAVGAFAGPWGGGMGASVDLTGR